MNIYLSLRDIQLEENKMLKQLASYLENNNICYVLAGGSMLGAVRHNGFIPWDDDIDILIPRKDYEKLKRMIRTGNVSLDGYEFKLPGDEKYPYPFIKMINPKLIADEEFRDEDMKANLWIDLFPLDHFPNNYFMHKFYIHSNSILKAFLYYGTVSEKYLQKYGQNNNLFQSIKVMIAKCGFCLCGGYKGVTLLMDKYAELMDRMCRNSNYVGDGTWPIGMKDYFSVDSLFPIIKHRFEDGEYCIPANYDGYLKKMYGDYMKLPNEEDRADHHIEVYYSEGEG